MVFAVLFACVSLDEVKTIPLEQTCTWSATSVVSHVRSEVGGDGDGVR